MIKFLLSILILFSFTGIASAEKTFLYFGATWCGPCGQFKQTLHEPDIAKLLVQYNNYYVDIDKHPDLKSEYKIKSIPTVIIIEEKIVNGKEVETVLYRATYPRKTELKANLAKYLDKKMVEPRPLLKILEKPVKFFQKALDKKKKKCIMTVPDRRTSDVPSVQSLFLVRV